MNNVAVILGAGAGTRMKSEKSKLLLEIGGKTVIERTVAVFSELAEIDEIIVVCRESDLESFESVLADYDISYCFGGETRQESVMNAVETIDECDYILIHDGARPLVTREEILRTLDKAIETGASAVGVPVKDTIKVVDKNKKIIDTPDRTSLISIRTPQAFDFKIYLEAIKKAKADKKDYTDDCQLVESMGRDIYVVIGEYDNIKITTPDDIIIGEGILKMRGEQ